MIRRSFLVLWKLLPLGLCILLDFRRFLIFGGPRYTSIQKHQKRAKKLTKNLASLGPTFIKLAQMFSSRSDIVPKVYLDQLATLQDKAPPFDTALVEKIIEGELMVPISEIFPFFERLPLAAASLGQVHKALYDGEEVAVKVLRPGVNKLVGKDLKILFRIAWLLNLIFNNHHTRAIEAVVMEFAKTIREEMDFALEAENAIRFKEDYRDNEDIIIPKVYREISTRRVLVLKYYWGVKIDQVDEITRMGLSIPEITDILTRFYLKQVLIKGFFHADPHPGNILVDGKGKVILLDFGMVSRIDEYSKKELIKITTAAASKDVDLLVEGLYNLGVIDPDISESQMREAASFMMDILDRDYISHKRAQEIGEEILSTFYKFPLQLPHNLVYLFKTVAVLEGIGIKYSPDYNLAKGITPAVKEMKDEILVDRAKDPIIVILERVRSFYQIMKNAKRVIEKAEKEELRVRLHPEEIIEVMKYMGKSFRRVLLGLIAASNAIITAILFEHMKNYIFLFGGLGISFILLVGALRMPRPGFSNPGKRARVVRGQGSGVSKD